MGLVSFNKMLLVAQESTYGTDALPTGSNVVRVGDDIAMVPIAADLVERNQRTGFIGRTTPQLLTKRHRTITFSVEFSGSGAAGVAPAWAPLAACCGYGTTIDPGVSVTLNELSPSAIPGCSVYGLIDGVQGKLIGCRGQIGWTLNLNQVPMLQYELTGILVPLSDENMPTPTFANHADPLPFENSSGVTGTVHGYAGCMSGYTYSAGNVYSFRNLVNCAKHIPITQRSGSGSVTMEFPTVAQFDFMGAISARTQAPIVIQFEDLSGGVIVVNHPTAVLTPTGPSTELEGIEMIELPFDAVSATANTGASIVITNP